jgi:hypothetical protein
MVSGGKEGILYVVKRSNMGKLNTESNNNQIVQSFVLNDVPNNIHGSPAYYKGPNSEYIYVWAEYDYLRAFQLDRGAGKFVLPNSTHSTMKAPDGMPGGMVSISCNGTLPGTGIIWATHPFSGNANIETRPGILRAFDALDLTKELWNTKENLARDDFGNFAKFCYPTIANGRVYLPTFSNQVAVYGLLDVSANQIETNEDVRVRLLPVPASNYFDIMFGVDLKEVEISILDIHCKLVLRQFENASNTVRVHLGDLPNGVYFVTISNEEIHAVKRITVVK